MPAGESGSAPRSEGAFVIVGRVRKPQGLHGEVLVEPITDAPDAIFVSGARVHLGTAEGESARDADRLTVTRARPFKDGWILRFAEAADRDAVESWRGRYLLVPQRDLPALAADEVYLHELLGMRVLDDVAGEIGSVIEVYELPQGITLEIARDAGSVLLPYRGTVREVDRDERVVRIAAPHGLLD